MTQKITLIIALLTFCRIASAETNANANPDAAHWDITRLDTARDADYLTRAEKDVILEMNMARSDPKKYAELYIRPMLRNFNGKNYSKPGEDIILVTNEGTSAVYECIAALSRADSAGLLTPEKGLSLAAKELAADQSKTGRTGHSGSGGSTLTARCAKYGKTPGSFRLGENIHYGNNTGREIVISLLINDGNPSRGHRKNLMHPDFEQIGTSIGTHPEYKHMCVVVYAYGYASD
jgi:uncharacterized protein YkwD